MDAAILKLRAANSTDRKAKAYGYARVSHADGYAKEESVPAQHNRIKQYYEDKLVPEGVEWGDTRDDGTNISAFKVPFHQRPGGCYLLSIMKPGDHLILDKVDRIWRSVSDFARVMETLENRGIKVHIVNFLGSSIQNDTPMGQFMLKQTVLFAELESRMKSERIKEGFKARQSKGESSFTKRGCKWVETTSGKKLLKWCPIQRALAQEIVRLLDLSHGRWKPILDDIEAYNAKIEFRDPEPRETYLNVCSGRRRRWDYLKQAEYGYMYLGITDPSQIPKTEILNEAARQQRRLFVKKWNREHGKNYKVIDHVPAEDILALS